MATIRVSAAMLRQAFRPCDPIFIANVCHARCCDAPTRPDGMLVTVHASERERIEARGARVDGAFLRPRDGARGCPFKDGASHLCGLHATPDKPFGCIVSPFTLNDHGTLIVRNRYRMLPCYRADGAVPAYVAHAASLVRLFGRDAYDDLRAHLDGGGGDMFMTIEDDAFNMLRENDAAKRGA